MDKKDIQILKELDKSSRQSNNQIAKKTKLKKETVGYRIKKLEEQGIIKNYFAVIDYFLLGQKIFKILLKSNNLGQKEEDSISKFLEKNKEVVWFSRTEGHYDFILTIRVEAIQNLANFLSNLKKNFPSKFKEKEILIATNIETFNEKYLYSQKEKGYKISTNLSERKEKIDEKDKIILNQIEGNSRIMITELSEKIKLTPEATLERIKKLKKKNIIQHYKIRLNFSEFGLFYNQIYIKIKDYSKLEEIKKFYENSNHCIFLMEYEGNYDLHLEWTTKREELREKINELRENFGEFIEDYKIISILEEHKIL